MVNQDYNVLNDWMFGKLTALLENIEHNPKYPILKMSLGEPTLGVPKLAKNILDSNKKMDLKNFMFSQLIILVQKTISLKE